MNTVLLCTVFTVCTVGAICTVDVVYTISRYSICRMYTYIAAEDLRTYIHINHNVLILFNVTDAPRS